MTLQPHIPRWPPATAEEKSTEVPPKRLWIEDQAGGDGNPGNYKVDKEIQKALCEEGHAMPGENDMWWLDQASQLPEQVQVD